MKVNSNTIPSIFTIGNFLLGFLSILKILDGNFYTAAWFIILAVLCDGMDGKIARMTHSESSFGFELDSLADMVSFGAAPALLVYQSALHTVPILGTLFCFGFFLAGGYRLARFNVIQAGNRSHGYLGLPIPIAAMTLAAFQISRFQISQAHLVPILFALQIIFILLMISTVPYDWPKLVKPDSLKNVLKLVGIFGSVAIMAFVPHYMLFPLLLLYVLYGFAEWVIDCIFGHHALTDFFIIAQKNKRLG